MSDVTRSAGELRKEFDRRFAAAPLSRAVAVERMIAVQVGPLRLALRTAELEGVHGDRRVVPLPQGPRALLGIAGIAGRAWAVYGLGELAGSSPAPAKVRWLALARGGHSIAFAFDAFLGQVEVEAADVRALTQLGAGAHVAAVARSALGDLQVLSVPSMLEALLARPPSAKELP